MVIISFLICLAGFTLVGLLSALQSSKCTKDYLLAGQNMQPWLVALAAVATNNSGFMFTGIIGYTYHAGLSSIWLIFPWILGDFLAGLFVHKKLRIFSEKQDEITFSGIISRWHGTNYNRLRQISAGLIIIFLGTYAAAQLSAGSKALHVLFGWNYSAGAILGSILVVAYCFAGGIRASIWTNTAQSLVMILAMTILSIAAITQTGGVTSFIDKLYAVSPTYMNLFPSDMLLGTTLGAIAMIIGWMSAGFGVIGQPHIMLQFMTMNSPSDMKKVRIYYYGWFTLFSLFTYGAGFAAKILLPETANFDSELALPMLAQHLLPDFLIGLILAGLFAATLSTADSQIISCAAALSQDLKIGRNNYPVTKACTIFVTFIALMIALFGNKSVFALVLIAWSALGTAFAPLLCIYALGGRISEKTAISMMFGGLTATLIWKFYGLSDSVMYEIFPGMLISFLIYGIDRMRFKQ